MPNFKLRFSLLFLLAVALLVTGIFNTYQFWWSDKVDKSTFRIIISFLTLGSSALLLSYLLTLVFFVPANIQFDFLALAGKGNFLKVVNEIGNKKVQQIITKNMVLYFVILITLTFSVLASLKAFEKYQLSHFGIIENAKIDNVSKSLKGFEITVIGYNYGSKHYAKELYLNNYRKGEKHQIIFSKNNPQIIVWYDDFLKGD